MQIFNVTWTCASPSELLLGVMKPEVSNLILDIVIHQKIADFNDLIIICHIEGAPLEAFGKCKGLFGDVFWLKDLDLTLLDWLPVIHDWLRVPKFMLAQNHQKIFESIPLEKMDVHIFRELLKLLDHLLLTEIG
jgi:hypothetical protein